MRPLMKRLEALEAGSTAPDDRASQIIITDLGADDAPPANYATSGEREIWRREDETPEDFTTRAKAAFPGTAHGLATLLSIGRVNARPDKAA